MAIVSQTELTMLEMLRGIHPEFHVTCTSPSKFDLFGYAAAGHATVKLDCDEATMDATRTYKVKSKGKQSEGERVPSYWGYEISFVSSDPLHPLCPTYPIQPRLR